MHIQSLHELDCGSHVKILCELKGSDTHFLDPMGGHPQGFSIQIRSYHNRYYLGIWSIHREA